MKLKAKKTDTSVVIQEWENYQFKLFPGSKSTKPYVHFQFVNPETGKEERQRILKGLKPGATLAVLTKQAKLIVEALIDLLSNGWNPINKVIVGRPITPNSPIVECIDNWLATRAEAVANNAIKEKALTGNTYLMTYFKTWLKSKQFLQRKPNTFTYLDINNFLQYTAKVRNWNKVSYNT